MGKFINTQYYDTVDTIVQLNNDLVQNPFYLFNDKKCTKVKYYNINFEKTTLDPASKLSYTDLGEESPIPNVPCVIIYPKEGRDVKNPFANKRLRDLCTTPVRKLARFYKVCVPLPVMGTNK